MADEVEDAPVGHNAYLIPAGRVSKDGASGGRIVITMEAGPDVVLRFDSLENAIAGMGEIMDQFQGLGSAYGYIPFWLDGLPVCVMSQKIVQMNVYAG